MCLLLLLPIQPLDHCSVYYILRGCDVCYSIERRKNTKSSFKKAGVVYQSKLFITFSLVNTVEKDFFLFDRVKVNFFGKYSLILWKVISFTLIHFFEYNFVYVYDP